MSREAEPPAQGGIVIPHSTSSQEPTGTGAFSLVCERLFIFAAGFGAVRRSTWMLYKIVKLHMANCLPMPVLP
ncbi:hypothetical protein GALL_96410 [mine drainage metagenome]|uniref:Uncharacterized protein n=1 Tax=mine drainage metagenome TaxID=410659 RepID=A0A1J5T2R6_9ZZZZ